MIRPIIVLILWASAASAAGFIADSSRGRELFERLSCVQCHSISGKGGSVGPDLGRILDRGFTPAMLAATMWNHAPTMWAAMGEMGIRAGHMSDQGAADLFAFFYATHFFELPGDAARGKRLFAARGCADCHGLGQAALPRIKPVSQWEALDDPVALTEAMWNHASQKLSETEGKHKAWRALTSQDLSDILVYVRNLPFPRPGVPAFQIGGGGSGETIFRERGCANCHKSGPELSKATRGKTLTQVAAAMWNHEPALAKAGAAQAALSGGDMKELLGYLWAGQFFENAGSPGHRSPRLHFQKDALPVMRAGLGWRRNLPDAEISTAPPLFPRSGVTDLPCRLR